MPVPTPSPRRADRPGPKVLAFASLLLPLLGHQVGAGEASGRPVDFNREIRPILSNRCYACHGPDAGKRKGVARPLRLDTEGGAFEDLGGYSAIVRGQPDESELIQRVRSDDPNEVMPPPKHGQKLPTAEVERLVRWIGQGAPYARHWSYARPTRPPLPEVNASSWPRNAVDRFLLARIEEEGLAPSPEADRATLIRRVSLDLTGLPPTPEEVDAFDRDAAPDAYEKLVDRLLEKPSYGEHWARLWLDLARYADSAGYADDPARTIWAYRDYVIKSFNANKPFDRMTLEQIAGDLLPDASDESRIATAFHRNTMTNNEGGTNDEEFRNAAVVDRVNTTMAVWMGTTIACAQCHDHKYDPLSQADFFRLFAFFNNTQDADKGDESPTLPIESPEKTRRRAELIGRIEQHERAIRAPLSPHAEAMKADLERYFLDADEVVRKPARDELAGLKKQLADLKPETTVPILRELAGDARRKTKIQVRGNFLDLGDEVTEGVPEAILPLPPGVPRDRLALARWLVGDDNPMTARVIANRYWEQIFGAGLVPTSEEFGSQGEPPTHPELLDWLAIELVAGRWDLKRFLRLLVTSAAYRQSSKVTADGLRHDPANQWLARGPRFRLPAETVRDQALAVAGLLSPKMYGPPVRPPQPSSGLAAAFGGKIDWQTSTGDDKYRRGLYTTWRRSNPYPSMATFDAPNREVCTVRRSRTNTPLQALVTLNDPVYVEASQALARRMAGAGKERPDKIRLGVKLCLSRDPSEREVERLGRLYDDAYSRFAWDAEKARKMATEPLGPAPDGSDLADLAAWTVVANVLLNLDETLMRR